MQTKEILLKTGKSLTLYLADNGVWVSSIKETKTSRLEMMLVAENSFIVGGVEFSGSELKIIREYARTFYNRQKLQKLADNDCERLKHLISTIKRHKQQ